MRSHTVPFAAGQQVECAARSVPGSHRVAEGVASEGDGAVTGWRAGPEVRPVEEACWAHTMPYYPVRPLPMG